jgi:uncharacterized protein
MRYECTPLAVGRAAGVPLVLDDPLSFWGGVDAATGTIIDVHHPQVGSSLTSAILVLPAGRGSSSSSSVLAEIIRHRIGPAAIVLSTPDSIIAIGSLVAFELYGLATPVVCVGADAYHACCAARQIDVEADNRRGFVSTIG